MNVLSTLSSTDETRMSSIHQNLRGSGLGDMAIKVSGIQNVGQFTSTILGVRAQILVQLIQALKLDIARRSLVSVRGLVDNSHCAVLLCRLLEKVK